MIKVKSFLLASLHHHHHQDRYQAILTAKFFSVPDGMT
jgi:hypothetical protein